MNTTGEEVILVPSLDYCIYSRARNALRECLRQLINCEDESPGIQQRYLILKKFLEENDCVSLREKYLPMLERGQNIHFCLRMVSGKLVVNVEEGI